MKPLLALPALVACLFAAHADQAQVIGMEEAEYATAMLTPGTEIRHFCAPCGDTTWRPEVVGSIETVPFQGEEGTVELKVNGAAIDCAYVYFHQSGQWMNLARFLGMEVTDVPAVLEKDLPTDAGDPGGESGEAPPSGAFGRMHFRGGIDGKQNILAQLASDGSKISGAYVYTHVQEPIALHGGGDGEGGPLALKEFSGNKQTGDWRVELKRSPLMLEGHWLSPDQAKKLPVKLQAFAAPAARSESIEVNGMRLLLNADYPVFLFAGHPLAKALNDKVRTLVDAAQREARGNLETAAAEDLAGDIGYENVLGWDHTLSDYQILHCSDTFVCILFSWYDFSGGAHGNSGTVVLNLKAVGDGKVEEAKLPDFLADPSASLPAVSAMLIEDLKQQQASSVVSEEIKDFNAETLPAFTASANGLTFYFDPYAVASYAEGPFTVELTWDKLGEHGKRDLLK